MIAPRIVGLWFKNGPVASRLLGKVSILFVFLRSANKGQPLGAFIKKKRKKKKKEGKKARLHPPHS